MLLSVHPKDPEPRKIRTIVEALLDGAVIVCPTDTVYAFACSSQNARAIEEVTKLKGGRPQRADLSLLCKDLSQLSTYARAVSTPAFRMMKKALPGPYTFILPASSEIPKLFKNNKRTVGIRVPDHRVVSALVEALGHPLVAASVHDVDPLAGYSTDPEDIQTLYGHRVQLVLDSGPGGREASTVIDLTESEPRIMREGKGPIDELF